MPRPRATIFQRQAQQRVMNRARTAPAASARPSTVRRPSRNGPAPNRQTTTINVTAAPAKRAHVQAVRLIRAPSALGAGSAGRRDPRWRRAVRTRPPPVAGVRRRRSRRPARARCSHAAPSHPVNHSAARPASEAPSRQGLGRTRTSAPSRPKPPTANATASGPSRRPRSVVRRWWASKAAATRESSGSAGARSTRPTTDSVSRTGQPAPRADGDQPRQLVARQQVEQSRGRDEGRAGEIAGAQPGEVGVLRLDGDRGPVCGRAGRLGGGDLQQVGVAVVHDPVLRAGQQRREPAAHRPGAAAEVVDHVAVGCREVLDEVAGTGRGIGGLAQGEPSPADADRLGDHRAAPARTPARTDEVTGHPASDSRRSRAARRNRLRRSASPSQERSAAPRAAGSPGGTSSPGRVPFAP